MHMHISVPSLIAGFDILPGRGLPPLQRSASDALQLPSNPQPPSQSPSQSFARSASAGGPPADPAAASDDQLYNNAASEADWFRGGGSQTGGSHAGGLHAEQPDAEEPHMRLGLRMHQRFAVQQHVKALQHQLDTAAGDLQVMVYSLTNIRTSVRVCSCLRCNSCQHDSWVNAIPSTSYVSCNV